MQFNNFREIFRRFELEDGLRVILLPSQGREFSRIQIYIGVGSSDDPPKMKGMAHLLEHLVMGSNSFREADSVPVPFKQFTKTHPYPGGCAFKAETNLDYTAYQFTLPSSLLASGLFLYSRILFNPDFELKNLDLAKARISMERNSKLDGHPSGLLYETLYSHAFSRHPYRWFTFGQRTDYHNLTAPQISAFHRAYYTPDNMVIVLTTAAPAVEALKYVKTHLGGQKKGGAFIRRSFPAEPLQNSYRRKILYDRTPSDHILMGFKAPALKDSQRAGLYVLNQMLSAACGIPGALLRRKRTLLRTMSSDMPLTRATGLYEISATLKRGYDGGLGEDLIFTMTQCLRQTAAVQVNKAKISVLKQINLQPTSAWGDSVGVYELLAGDYTLFWQFLDRIDRLYPEEVLAIGQKLFIRECLTTAFLKNLA